MFCPYCDLIVCSSRGTGAGYSTESASIDRFVFQYKDMLVLFAAANDGDSGDRSLSTQGENKNAITVGAVCDT